MANRECRPAFSRHGERRIILPQRRTAMNRAVAIFALGLLSGLAPAAAQPAQNACFLITEFRGWKAPDTTDTHVAPGRTTAPFYVRLSPRVKNLNRPFAPEVRGTRQNMPPRGPKRPFAAKGIFVTEPSFLTLGVAEPLRRALAAEDYLQPTPIQIAA